MKKTARPTTLTPARSEASRRNGHLGGRPPGVLSAKTLAKREAARRAIRDAELTVEATIEAIARGALYDPRQLFDANGHLKPIRELSEADAFMIAGMDIETKPPKRNMTAEEIADYAATGPDVVVKVKLIDRGRYVELAAKYLGMLVERVEVSASADLLARLERGRLRNAGLLPANTIDAEAVKS